MIQDLVKGIRAFKTLVNELKDFYPEISKFIADFKKSGEIDTQSVKKAIDFVMKKILENPYIVLGVRKDDPPELIDAVYRVKAKFYHPDRGGDKEKFLKIKEAYEKIKSERV